MLADNFEEGLNMNKFVMVALLASAMGTSVSAATCTSSVASKVTVLNTSINDGCDLGSDSNDNVGGGVLDVNTDTMFGFSDWTFLGKNDFGTGETSLNFTITGNDQSGTWTISNLTYALYMLVLKGPNAQSGTQPDTYVGYLLSGTSGTYETPFFKTNPQDISHWSLYARGVAFDPQSGTIPVPAALPLMAGGLGLLELLRRRRRA